ncbi:MAG: hypothetical protein HJJLKODD_02764 [Phycisphaerae bacterium]|nr:hypothetical protein [Phycisphaerae bacterium]
MNQYRQQVGSMLIILSLLTVIAGCTRPQSEMELTQQKLTAMPTEQYDQLWDSCQFVLRQHCFQVDRTDRAAGIITSLPETSQYPLEFWRRDLATAYDYCEAGFHTLRRQVTIQISRENEQSELLLEVRVNKERLSVPERQINNPAGALRLFAFSSPGTSGRRLNPRRDLRWVESGRDAALERLLLNHILRHFSEMRPDLAGVEPIVSQPSEPSTLQ